MSSCYYAVDCDTSRGPFWAVLAIMILLAVGCGGGSSYSSFSSQSNPPTNPPSTSSPQFTTNPPTTATGGAQYVYQIAANDTSSGVVIFAITSGPAGAALSGNTLTWTPSQAQSRIANNFVVTATNATTGKTATQSWSVTPSGTIRGTRVITYVTESGDVLQPDDMTQFTTAAHVPNGSSYTTLSGVGATDGTYSIQGVPAGYFWLQQDRNYVWTNAANIDLGFATLGRPDLVTPQQFTWIGFDLSGLSGWQSTDALEWFIANTNVEGLYTGYPTGAITIKQSELWSGALIDSSKGDRVYVGQLVTSTFSGKTIQVLDKILGPLSLTVTDGSTANVAGTMTDVTLGNTMRANFKSSAFSQYQADVNPQATNDATFVLLGALPGGSAKGPIGYPAYLVTYVNANGPFLNDVDLGDISYGNPFPTSWAPMLQYVQEFALQYAAPGASNSINAYPLVYVGTTNLPTITAPLQPLVAPVVLPRINGLDLFQNHAAVGTTPIISWQAPQPAPTGYGITLYRLYASGSDSQIELLAYLWTDSTTVTLPPNLMSSGNTYLFRIRSFNAPGMDIRTAPYRQTFPWAYADVFSAMMNP